METVRRSLSIMAALLMATDFEQHAMQSIEKTFCRVCEPGAHDRPTCGHAPGLGLGQFQR